MQIGFDIVKRSLRDGDVSGALRAIRNGVTWRSRRARQRVRRGLRRRGLLRSRPASSRRSDRPVMTSEGSVAAANRALRSMGAADPVVRPLVRGPELSVAVVVPTYSDTGFLADALRSVQQQTYPHWRCYVVDDASPQDVDAVMGEFRDDERFVLLRHAANAGLAAARNTGVLNADEDVLQFLDADDLLTPWSLERRVDDLRNHWHDPVVAGVHGQIMQCTEETTLADVSTWDRKVTVSRRDWLQSEGESPFNVHAPLVRTEVIRRLGGFDESFLNGAEDWDLWHRVLRHGFSFEGCQCVVGAYRQRTASMVRAHSGVHLGRADALFEASDRWATVDGELAVSNATMPVGDGRRAHKRLVRAARWAGIRAAQSGTLDEPIDDEILEFLDPSATVGTRRDEYVHAARGGVIRGLGLAVHVVDDLDVDAARVIDVAAERIADQLLDYCASHREPHAGTVDLVRRSHVDVLLIPRTSDEVARLTALAELLVAAGADVVFVDVAYVDGDAGTVDALRGTEYVVVPFNSVAFGSVSADLMVSCPPIAPGTLALFRMQRDRGGSVCCLRDDEPLIVDGLAADLHGGPSLEAVAIVALATDAGAVAPRFDPVTPTNVGYSALLPYEENALDAAGHEWLLGQRDRCAGRTAIIIGNGPSLNDIDFDLLAQGDTFGVNSIFLASERLPKPLTYYVVEDTAVFKDNTAAIKAYHAETKLFPSLYRPRFSDAEVTPNTHFFRMNMGFYGRKSPFGPTGTECLPRFSTNAAQRVFCGQSVTIINLQLAHWFGYTRVLLIGMDFSYQIPADAHVDGNLIVSQSADPNHFHPDYFGAGKTWKDPKLDRVLVNYRLAHRVYRATGREILNCTVGGNLHEFPRMSLEDALRAPVSS